MLALALVALSMAVQDVLATVCVIAESNGQAVLAGLMDAAGDVARTVGFALGAGEIAVHGWDGYAVEVLAVMAGTSFVATAATTWWGRKLGRAAP